jgi:hypothetical protein
LDWERATSGIGHFDAVLGILSNMGLIQSNMSWILSNMSRFLSNMSRILSNMSRFLSNMSRILSNKSRFLSNMSRFLSNMSRHGPDPVQMSRFLSNMGEILSKNEPVPVLHGPNKQHLLALTVLQPGGKYNIVVICGVFCSCFCMLLKCG